MTVEIEKIFNKSRFSGGPSLLILALYAPIGVALLILRIFISLQLCVASLILPSGTILRKFVLRVLYSVLGIIVQEQDAHKKDDKCRVLVSNHLSPFDHLAISLVHPCVSASASNLPMPLSSIFCFHNFDTSQGREVLRSNIRTYLNKPDALPLLLYPEGGTTSGDVALMKYSTWGHDIDKSVLAIGLRVKRIPVLYIAPSVLGASWIADLFYLLFLPVTVFSVRYIGKITKDDAESVEDFALRVQKATATSLNLQVSNHTVNDKVEYIKRLRREEVMASNPFLSPEIHTMALQVREVLPHIPLEIIKRDLVQTRNVDMTVTNFLEGNIPDAFPQSIDITNNQPGSSRATLPSESNPSTSTVFVSSSSATVTVQSNPMDPHDLNMAAKTFGKSANERTQSFEERKHQLIEKARQRYMQKHGLSLTPNNAC